MEPHVAGEGGAHHQLAGATDVEEAGLEAETDGEPEPSETKTTKEEEVMRAMRKGLQAAGIPVETPAVTVNRLCGSGFEAVVQGAQQILLGESQAVLAGGTESMSQAPHVVRGARWGLRLGPAGQLEDTLWEALRDPSCGLSMAETAENLAARYCVSRQAVDCYAARSQAAAAAADRAGRTSTRSKPAGAYCTSRRASNSK